MVKLNLKFKHSYRYSIGFFEYLLSLLLFINYFFANDYISLLCSIFACASLFTVSRSKVLPLAVYYSFFAYLFCFSGYELYIFIAISFLIRAALESPKKVFSFAVISASYVAVHIFSSLNLSLKLGDFIPFAANLGLFAAVSMYKHKYREDVLNAFLGGYFISSILGLFKSQTRLTEHLEDDYLSLKEWHDTVRFAGLSYDANFYSILSIVVLLMLMFDYNTSFAKKRTRLYLLFCTIVFGILTFSRSLIICYILIFALSLISRNKNIRKKTQWVLLFCCFMLIVFGSQVITALGLIADRFSDISASNLMSSGRLYFWFGYLKNIFRSVNTLLIGAGVHGRLLSMVAAHNIFIELLYKFGTVGLLFDLFYLNMCSKAIPKTKARSIFDSFCILLLFLLLFNLSAYTFYSLWVCIFITIVMTKDGKDDAVNSYPDIQQ